MVSGDGSKEGQAKVNEGKEEVETREDTRTLAEELVRARAGLEQKAEGSQKAMQKIAGKVNGLGEQGQEVRDLAEDPKFQTEILGKALEGSQVEKAIKRERHPGDSRRTERAGELRPVELKEQVRPWEEYQSNVEDRMSDRYEKPTELGELKEQAGKVLDQEYEHDLTEYARAWYKANREKLKGMYDENANDALVFKTARERGGFEDLKQNSDWQEWNERLRNLSLMQHELHQDKVPVESRFLILNILQKRRVRLEGGARQMREGGDEAAVQAVDREVADLLSLQERITEKTTGRDARKEAETGAGELAPKQMYADTRFVAEKEERLKGANRKLEDELQLMRIGLPTDFEADKYSIKYEKSFFRRKLKKIEFIDRRTMQKVREFTTFDEMDEFLKEEVKEQILGKAEKEFREELGADWDREDAARKDRIEKAVAQEIEKYAKTPEQAEEEIEGMYGRVRKRIIRETVEKDFKKEPKSKEQLAAIKREFSKKGAKVDVGGFIEGLADWEDGEEVRKLLAEDPEEALDNINGFFGGLGIFSNREVLGSAFEARQKERAKPGEGFIVFMLKLLAEAFELAPEKTNSNKGRRALQVSRARSQRR